MGSRPYQLKYKYGITEAVYDAMLERQDGKCAICGTTEPGTNGGEFFAIDHVREPFQIRGLLCRGCNLVLGSAKDSIEILEAAVAYLKEIYVRRECNSSHRQGDGEGRSLPRGLRSSSIRGL